jgi:hypothetical protein
MANQIVRRLIAAGASPQRASQFATQFQQSLPGTKPREIQDAFDAEIAALSKAFFPNTFRPPSMENPQFLDYAIGVFGEDAIRTVIKDNFAKYAPTFTKAQTGGAYEQKLATLITEDKSLAQLNKQFQDDLLAGEDTGFASSADGQKYIAKLFGEYSKANNLSLSGVNTFLNKDKFYKAGLPDPKLKYGKEEDLSAGVISWKTHPQVDAYLKKPEVASKIATVKAQRTAPAAGYIAAAGPQAIEQFKATRATPDVEDTLFEEFASSKANPFKDEVIRRESLKKKTLLK